MGVWGAAQAVAFGLGGILGTGVIDVMRFFVGSNTHAYSAAFTLQATIFIVASVLAATLSSEKARASWSQQSNKRSSYPANSKLTLA